MRAALIAVLMPWCLHCATVNTETKDTAEFVRMQESTRVIEGSRTYSASTERSDDAVKVSIRRADRCAIVRIPLLKRTRYVTNTEEPPSPGTSLTVADYIFGLAFTTLGGVMLNNPSGACNGTSMDGSRTETDPSVCRNAGFASAGLGALLLGLGVFNSVRLRDRTIDMGVVPGPATEEHVGCAEAPAASENISLTIGDARIKRRTDTRGIVLFRPEEFGASPRSGGSAMVEIHGYEVQVLLPTEPPNSGDPLHRAVEAPIGVGPTPDCLRSVERAREQSRATDWRKEQVVAVRALWLQARTACANLWTDELVADQNRVESTIAVAMGRAVVRELEASNPGGAREILEAETATRAIVGSTPNIVELLHRSLADAANGMRTGGHAGAPAAAVCELRRVFALLGLRKEWGRLRLRVARRVAEFSAESPARWEKILEQAACSAERP